MLLIQRKSVFTDAFLDALSDLRNVTLISSINKQRI